MEVLFLSFDDWIVLIVCCTTPSNRYNARRRNMDAILDGDVNCLEEEQDVNDDDDDDRSLLLSSVVL